MCFMHKWSMWEQYETTVLSYFYSIPCKTTNVRQNNRCEKCGKMVDEYVSNKQLDSITKENIPTADTN